MLVLGVLGAGCGGGATGAGRSVPEGAPPVDAAAVAREVGAVLDDWHAAAASADEERYFSHFAPHGVFLGTDASERWELAAFRAYAHPYFAQGHAWSFRSMRRNVAVGPGGDVAWFDEDLATENLGPCRGSGVMLRGDDGVWRIALYDLAITVPNERFVEVRELLAGPPPPPPATPAPAQ